MVAKFKGGAEGVPVGGIVRFSANEPKLIQKDDVAYLKSGSLATSGFDPSLSPVPYLLGDWSVVEPTGLNRPSVDTDDAGVWCMIAAGVIRRSTDDGLTWTQITPNIPSTYSDMYYIGNGVWMATAEETATTIKYRSVDNGLTWASISSPTSKPLVVGKDGVILSITGNWPAHVSYDYGATWQTIASPGVQFNIGGTDGDGNWLFVSLGTNTDTIGVSKDNLKSIRLASMAAPQVFPTNIGKVIGVQGGETWLLLAGSITITDRSFVTRNYGSTWTKVPILCNEGGIYNTRMVGDFFQCGWTQGGLMFSYDGLNTSGLANISALTGLVGSTVSGSAVASKTGVILASFGHSSSTVLRSNTKAVGISTGHPEDYMRII